ncbi:hypothetical protein ASPACDRAFT_1858473 [Aspergillus aculeatus ATCC 16872]|uniref:Uncharacterized protein n=1 Tax=Aspergillus aculeatus (strain ATCC 16872 / CBS 172.66 / WB 5094) TaxID=690307 RepID=A0A1L9WNJ7_ASPA1|nr:uncharacterized protein ASPACDRAFT_1858473 [Aspergillus aculeatus ATCC 16872]OJJ97749.1 hypothetical protein ASPACDRAFT_1858473 [Aspergillus aculeatus ATCC 16872]
MTTSKFWLEFPDFKPNPHAPITEEFKRLAAQRGWKPGSRTWRKRWNAFVNIEYDRVIGSRLASLEEWRKLCALFDLPGPFPSITKCKQALSTVHVNLVDLIECRQSDTKPKTFTSVAQLAKYTRDTGKFFHRTLAKQDKLLKVFLRRLA